MTDPTPSERDALSRALRDSVPDDVDARGRAERALTGGRRLRQRRRVTAGVAAVAAVAAIVAAPTVATRIGGLPDSGPDPAGDPTSSDAATPPPSESSCRNGVGAEHTDLSSGDVAFLQFCVPPGTWNGVVQAPSEALTEGLPALVEGWQPTDLRGCQLDPITDQYRLQVVYEDGSYAQIVGATGECQPVINGDQPLDIDGWQLFSQVIAAYGDQYAGRVAGATGATDEPLDCPAPGTAPGETDVDGGSAVIARTGLVLPVPPVAALICPSDGDPVTLSGDDAAQVRVALQTLSKPGDCVEGPGYTLLFDDATGTRRTLSLDECGAVDSAFRGGPPDGAVSPLLSRMLAELSD